MNQFVFFDTETTSVDEGRLLQLAMLHPGVAELNEMYKPPVPISFEAMAVHHITEKMVADMGPFDDSARARVMTMLKNNVPVAHNIEFDAAVMAREGIVLKDPICTLKLARKLWPDWPQHKLQYLRYRLGIDIAAGEAHSAMADVLVLQAVFDHIYHEIAQSMSDDLIVRYMQQVTREPSLLYRFTFGKHRGETFEEVAAKDLGYLDWLSKQKDVNVDLQFTLQHWLKKIMG